MDSQPKALSKSGLSSSNVSYNIMEYAPFGDVASLMINNRISNDITLQRTMFHQLIEGLTYLHQNGVAHLDLKPENILIGEGYRLKIADFDSSFIKNDTCFKGRGTVNYRGPEVITGTCRNPFQSDIFSAGIILLTILTGNLAYLEKTVVEGFDLEKMVLTQDEKFWEAHAKCTGSPLIVDPEIKKLFWSMVRADASSRATLEQIKSSKWYQGTVYSTEEYIKRMFKTCV
jgi:serine/threonine protein kinase